MREHLWKAWPWERLNKHQFLSPRGKFSPFQICLSFRCSKCKVLHYSHLIIHSPPSSCRRECLFAIFPPFPLVLFQQVFCTLLPKHLFSLHWDISFKFFLSLSFLVRSQILPSDHPLLFPPLLLCVLLSIPEVLITQTHFSTAKQRHLRLNQLCLSQKGYIYNAEIGADRCVLSQEIKAMTHKSDRCEQPKQIC